MALISLLILLALMPFFGRSDHVNDGIVNGTEAKPHSRPYMVSVQSLIHFQWRHNCGGFLVSDQFVMTAAHCWKYGQNLTVVIGAHGLYNMRINYTHMAVKFYHIYPAYHHADSDIMLLQLDGKVKFNSNISTINIMKANRDVKANSICSVAGWGSKTFNGHTSKRLMEVNATVKSQQVCKKLWKDKFKPSMMMCAGGHGGFCKGDSGGPLVCNNTAVGIVSFLTQSDKPYKPNVFTKISNYLPWINGIIHSV